MQNNSYEKAITKLEKAILQGDSNSKYNLGLALLHGKGVEVDLLRANKLFKEAYAEGYSLAAYPLGVSFYFLSDFESSKKYLNYAYSLGIKGSSYYLGMSYLKAAKNSEELDLMEKHLLEAGSSGTVQAFMNLARAYTILDSIEKDDRYIESVDKILELIPKNESVIKENIEKIRARLKKTSVSCL